MTRLHKQPPTLTHVQIAREFLSRTWHAAEPLNERRSHVGAVRGEVGLSALRNWIGTVQPTCKAGGRN